MNDPQDLWSAIRTRERGRSLVRVATLTVGAGALVAAGVVAAMLPSPQHKTAGSAQGTATAPRLSHGGEGDDDNGSGAISSPAPAPAPAPAQAVSGGS